MRGGNATGGAHHGKRVDWPASGGERVGDGGGVGRGARTVQCRGDAVRGAPGGQQAYKLDDVTVTSS